MILINIIVFVIILVPLTRANHRLLENDDDGDDDDHDDEDDDYNVPSIPEIITLVHGAVCQQGKFEYLLLMPGFLRIRIFCLKRLTRRFSRYKNVS